MLQISYLRGGHASTPEIRSGVNGQAQGVATKCLGFYRDKSAPTLCNVMPKDTRLTRRVKG